jgi:hypothetical protein
MYQKAKQELTNMPDSYVNQQIPNIFAHCCNFTFAETIEPSWDGMAAEETHYLMYKNLLEKEYGSGN